MLNHIHVEITRAFCNLIGSQHHWFQTKLHDYRFCTLKAHANGPNIVGANNVVTCCVRLHGTTTMLALVAYSLKPVKLLGPCKRTQHCWPTTPNNVGSCWHLLRPFAWAFSARRNPFKCFFNLARAGFNWHKRKDFRHFIVFVSKIFQNDYD